MYHSFSKTLSIDTTLSISDLDHPKDRWTIDQILDLTNESITLMYDYTPHELDSVIGDISYILAFEKKNDRTGKHWKHITLDVETQALICKLAAIETNLVRLEEHRMDITLAAMKGGKQKSKGLRRRYRKLWNAVKELRSYLKR